MQVYVRAYLALPLFHGRLPEQSGKTYAKAQALAFFCLPFAWFQYGGGSFVICNFFRLPVVSSILLASTPSCLPMH
jgi:hypothetical protein